MFRHCARTQAARLSEKGPLENTKARAWGVEKSPHPPRPRPRVVQNSDRRQINGDWQRRRRHSQTVVGTMTRSVIANGINRLCCIGLRGGHDARENVWAPRRRILVPAGSVQRTRTSTGTEDPGIVESRVRLSTRAGPRSTRSACCPVVVSPPRNQLWTTKISATF